MECSVRTGRKRHTGKEEKRHTGKEENGIPARKSRIKRHKCKKKGNTHYCAGRDSNSAPPR